MANLWHLGGLRPAQLGRNVWRAIDRDDILGQAAKLSYYFLLALVPLLLLLTTLFGYFAQSADLRADLLGYFRRVVPRSAFQLVVSALDQVTRGAGGGKLSLGIIGTLWAASAGMAAIIRGLNQAYRIEDERPWWKVRLVAVGLTLAFAVFTLAASLLVLAGSTVGRYLAGRFGYEAAFVSLWNLLRWPVALALVLIAIDLLYRFAPDLKDWKWHWATPGAVVAVTLWVTASLGFRLYLRFFNTYATTYGSLGAVIILMLWLYVTSAAILIGAEVNSEIESAAARSGDREARLPGQKAPGERRSKRAA